MPSRLRRPIHRLTDTPQWSDAAEQVARWFDLAPDLANSVEPAIPDDDVPLPTAGQVMLVTGPSGAGKTSLLRRLQGRHETACFTDLADVAWQDGLVIDQFGDDIEGALVLLARFGLGEARTYLRPPSALSDGQRWRLRLARAVHGAPASATLIADEFAAVLDRVTAHVVSRALRRAIDASRQIGAIVATSHDDLTDALLPDLFVRCDFNSITWARRT